MPPQPVLQGSRGDVLATGGHNEFLLAPGDPQKPLGALEGADITGTQPPVVGEGLGGGLEVVVVPGEGADTPHEDLPILTQPDRTAGERCADGADPGGAGQIDGAWPHGLGQAVALQDGDPGATVEVPQALTQRPAAGHDVADPPAQDGAQGGEDEAVEGGTLRLQPA